MLVVESDLSLALQYQLELLAQGHQVNIVHSAEDALGALTPALDVVITDLRLPGMSGEEFIRSLRGRPEFVDLPVLVITAATALPDSLRDQVTKFRRKPFDFDRLGEYAQDAAGPRRFRN